MTHRSIEPAQQVAARVVGLLYLLTMASSVFAEMIVRDSLVVPGDAVATAQKIAGAAFFFRLGLLADLFTCAGVVALNWGLYVILRPVDHRLALLGAFLRLVEAAIAGSLLVGSFFVLRLLGKSDYLNAFNPEQLAVLARVFLGSQATGLNIVFVILGLGSTVYGILWFRSGYIPRPLAALGIMASVALSSVTALIVLFPSLGTMLNILYMLPLGIFEVGLGLLLFIGGLRAPASGSMRAGVSGEVPA